MHNLNLSTKLKAYFKRGYREISCVELSIECRHCKDIEGEQKFQFKHTYEEAIHEKNI